MAPVAGRCRQQNQDATGVRTECFTASACMTTWRGRRGGDLCNKKNKQSECGYMVWEWTWL